MRTKSPQASTLILLLISSLVIWAGYHIMKLERWADKYLFIVGLLAAVMGAGIIGYLIIWSRE